jgi:hypothetical protein
LERYDSGGFLGALPSNPGDPSGAFLIGLEPQRRVVAVRHRLPTDLHEADDGDERADVPELADGEVRIASPEEEARGGDREQEERGAGGQPAVNAG